MGPKLVCSGECEVMSLAQNQSLAVALPILGRLNQQVKPPIIVFSFASLLVKSARVV